MSQMSRAIIKRSILGKPTNLTDLLNYLSTHNVVTRDYLNSDRSRTVKGFTNTVGYLGTNNRTFIYWNDNTHIIIRKDSELIFTETYFQVRRNCRYYYGVRL